MWAGKRIALAFAVAALGAGGWLVTDALEANNDFCNACHLSAEVPLHAEIRAGFDADPPHTLAGAHARAVEVTRAERPVTRCIDCHGGVGAIGRAKVKLLAAKDALAWISGNFDEPTHMEYPLGEADCRKCHLDLETDWRPAFGQSFHGLSVHNVDLGVTCVECHSVHEGGDHAEMFFMDEIHVRKQCGRCHSEFRQ